MKLKLIIVICLTNVLAYKPVVIIHGIMTGAPSMQLIEEQIQTVIRVVTVNIIYSIKMLIVGTSRNYCL